MSTLPVRLDPAVPGRPIAQDALAQATGIAEAARVADGTAPLNEQTMLDLASGRRTARLARRSDPDRDLSDAGSDPDANPAVAVAVTGHGELDLVVDPAYRGQGIGKAVLEQLLPELEPDVSAWSHGDDPAARALAHTHGFVRVRTLYELRLPELRAARLDDAAGRGEAAAGIRLSAFEPATDAADWLALNARAFAAYPDQGGMTADDLAQRMGEPWFDREDFLIARDEQGRMAGFDWLKVDDDACSGEIYVLAVDPDVAGRGLGRALLVAGLRRMLARGLSQATLYVDGENDRAIALYRSLGFVDHVVDVQYRRSGEQEIEQSLPARRDVNLTFSAR